MALLKGSGHREPANPDHRNASAPVHVRQADVTGRLQVLFGGRARCTPGRRNPSQVRSRCIRPLALGWLKTALRHPDLRTGASPLYGGPGSLGQPEVP